MLSNQYIDTNQHYVTFWLHIMYTSHDSHRTKINCVFPFIQHVLVVIILAVVKGNVLTAKLAMALALVTTPTWDGLANCVEEGILIVRSVKE